MGCRVNFACPFLRANVFVFDLSRRRDKLSDAEKLKNKHGENNTYNPPRASVDPMFFRNHLQGLRALSAGHHADGDEAASASSVDPMRLLSGRMNR